MQVKRDKGTLKDSLRTFDDAETCGSGSSGLAESNLLRKVGLKR